MPIPTRELADRRTSTEPASSRSPESAAKRGLDVLLSAFARRPRDARGLDAEIMQLVAGELGAHAAWIYRLSADELELAGAHGLPDDVVARIAALGVAGTELASSCVVTSSALTCSRSDLASAAPPERLVFERTEAAVIHVEPLVAYGSLGGVLLFALDDDGVNPPGGSRLEAIRALLGLALSCRRGEASGLEESALQILEAAPDGVLYVDKVTGHLLVSKSFERMYGRSFDLTRGVAQELGAIFWPDGRPLTQSELPSARALEGESLDDVELVICRHDGTRVPISQRAVPLWHNGRIRGAVVSIRDLSALKMLDQLRDDFAAMVAHDLRNPVQSILFQIQVLRDAAARGEPISEQAADRLARSGAQLAHIAADLLDATRVELSRIHLDRVEVDAAQAIRSLVERMRPTLARHDVDVVVDGSVPPAKLDPTRFDQVLTNLLDNAAKFSPEGAPIHVRLAAVDGGVEVTVRDEGMGIAPDELSRLFDRLYQTRRARERRTGLGLGLYITKGLVEAHGGRIHVESAVDRGSTFVVWLPSTTAEHGELRH